MIPALILIVWLCATGAVFVAYHKRRQGRRAAAGEDAAAASDAGCGAHQGICCGLHEICEKGLPKRDEDLYFDDEELDRFSGRMADGYSADEVAEFRDVMLTVPRGELELWARCMGRRRIQLPAAVRDELLVLMRGS